MPGGDEEVTTQESSTKPDTPVKKKKKTREIVKQDDTFDTKKDEDEDNQGTWKTSFFSAVTQVTQQASTLQSAYGKNVKAMADNVLKNKYQLA